MSPIHQPTNIGVEYSWVDHLKAGEEKAITEQMFTATSKRFPDNTPTFKEGYGHRKIFEDFFSSDTSFLVEKVLPAIPNVPFRGMLRL